MAQTNCNETEGRGPAGMESRSCRPRIWLRDWVLALSIGICCAASAKTSSESSSPSTPREFFNAGTRMLSQGKLREAEAYLESALASQSERLQPPALYNLGHTRFRQGVEELKKGPAAGPAAARGRSTVNQTDDANRSADEALAGEDVQKMVAAYLHGRGVRKELRAATKAVKRAMETQGAALSKWQRGSADFKSAAELNRADEQAKQNAETVDRYIARLVDSIQQLQQMAAAMGAKQRELEQKLKQLKGRIPEEDMPPGAAGDDEEEEDMPKGSQENAKEEPTKEGEEMKLSPEQAQWVLEGFKLDTERRLPMGQNDTAEPKDRSRKTW